MTGWTVNGNFKQVPEGNTGSTCSKVKLGLKERKEMVVPFQPFMEVYCMIDVILLHIR